MNAFIQLDNRQSSVELYPSRNQPRQRKGLQHFQLGRLYQVAECGVFQFPDNEEALLAMANLDTMSLTKRNPNSLDIASNAEAVLWRSLKGHVFDGNADACRPVKTVRRKIVGVQRY